MYICVDSRSSKHSHTDNICLNIHVGNTKSESLIGVGQVQTAKRFRVIFETSLRFVNDVDVISADTWLKQLCGQGSMLMQFNTIVSQLFSICHSSLEPF